MGNLLNIFGNVSGTLLGFIAKNTFLGWIAPLVSGIASAIGAIVTAIAEIVAALSKSPEGRVFLALIAAGAGFLYVRFHYIEEGRAEERAVTFTRTAEAAKACALSPRKDNKRVNHAG